MIKSPEAQPRTNDARRGAGAGRSPIGVLSNLIEAQVAPLLAPLMPDRYYTRYSRLVASAHEPLPTLAGLPSLIMERGFMPVALAKAAEPDTPLKLWDALALSPAVYIEGPVGSGKTTLLHYLAWQLSGRSDPTFVRQWTFKLHGRAVEDVIPIQVDLRDLSRDGHSLMDALVASMARYGFPGALRFLKERLESGQCALLLDNLEYLQSPTQQADLRQAMSDYPHNLWVLASRPGRPVPALQGGVRLYLRGVVGADYGAYLDLLLGARSSAGQGIQAACERSANLADFLRNPLMLLAACQAHISPGRTAQAVRLGTCYDACLEMLLGPWMTADGRANAGSLDEHIRALRGLAYRMQAERWSGLERAAIVAVVSEVLPPDRTTQAEPLVEELIVRAGILAPLPADEQRYGFLSPVLQSHLAAQYIVGARQTDLLLAHADDPRWRDTIILAAGLLAEPWEWLAQLESAAHVEPHKWLLLANCIAELPEKWASVQAQNTLFPRVSEHLYALLESDSDGATEAQWQSAAVAIAGMVRKQARPFYTGLATDQYPDARRRAVLTLGRLHQEWAIPTLGAAVADTDPGVRQQAAWALGLIPSSQAVPVLFRALRSPHSSLRQAAAESLARLGQNADLLKPVVRELIDALGDENDAVATLAEHALMQAGRPAMGQLTQALNDQRLRPGQRSRLARALGALGDERAMPVLLDAIMNGGGELEGYVQAVAGVGEKAVPAIIEALVGKDTTTGAGLVAALVRIGAPAVPYLIESIAGSLPEVRNAAVRALEQIGEPAAESLTHALLHDERYEVRRRALEILGHVGSGSIVPALVTALDDSDPGVRLNAVRFLGTVGNESAVEPLISVLQSDEHLALRRAAITSLSSLRDARSVEPLMDALDDPAQREVVTNALVELGEVAVEPLVRRLGIPEVRPEAREAAWNALAQIGSRARSEDPTLSGLASTFGKLRDGQRSPEEAVTLAEHIRWWIHGPEVHSSLSTTRALAAIDSLEHIGECGPLFEWMAEVTDWLRPYMKDILWGFKDIAENIKLYRTLSRRDSQRDALLSSIDKLAELQQRRAPKALPFEAVVVDQVITNWRTQLLDTIKQLRGRAALQIELLTPRLPLRTQQRITTAVFRLFNEGDSAARNLSVTIKPAVNAGLEIIGGERKNLDPLGIGEARDVEVSIAPRGLREAELQLEAHYDDDEKNDVTHRFSAHIGFYEAPSTYTPIESSPYIAGLPVKSAEMFFGRQDIFQWVRENISGRHGLNPLVLYGERRMGKTSVLYQLQSNPPTPQHLCLLFDLQLYGYINTVAELLFELASAIVARVARTGLILDDPDWDQYNDNPYRVFRAFSSMLDARLGDLCVVVMLDEFGVLMVKVRDKVFDTSIFEFFRGVVQSSSRLTFLFTGAYEVRRMQQDYDSILFNMAKTKKISYLAQGEATELIEKPVRGLLAYHPLVVNKILSVTACHPYFVQYVCDELVQLARSERKNYIELSDLDYVVKDVVQDATGNIENSIYNYLSRTERLALAALANATDDVRVFVSLADIIGVLEGRNLGMPRDEVMQALRSLVERDLVTEMRIGQQLRYSFRMGLVRMWLRQNEVLLRLGEEK